MVSGLDTSILGDQYVTVTYGQDIEGNPVSLDNAFQIEVVDYVKDIIVTQPTNASYEVGDTINLNGVTLKDVMAGGTPTSAVTIENAMAETNPDEIAVLGDTTLDTVGTKTIDVTWHGFTKQITVEVADVTLTPSYTAPTGANTFKYGNPENKQIDLIGGKIELKKKAGTPDEAVVETIDLSIPNSRVTFGTPDFTDLTPNQKVDVMLDGTKVGEITINVQDYITGIKVNKPTDSEYEVGETMDLTRRISRIYLGK